MSTMFTHLEWEVEIFTFLHWYLEERGFFFLPVLKTELGSKWWTGIGRGSNNGHITKLHRFQHKLPILAEKGKTKYSITEFLNFKNSQQITVISLRKMKMRSENYQQHSCLAWQGAPCPADTVYLGFTPARAAYKSQKGKGTTDRMPTQPQFWVWSAWRHSPVRAQYHGTTLTPAQELLGICKWGQRSRTKYHFLTPQGTINKISTLSGKGNMPKKLRSF